MLDLEHFKGISLLIGSFATKFGTPTPIIENPETIEND